MNETQKIVKGEGNAPRDFSNEVDELLNEMCTALEVRLKEIETIEAFETWSKFECWGLGATTGEIIDRALQLLEEN